MSSKNDGTLTITDTIGDDSGKITGGYAERGGAVNNSGALTISGGNLCNNKASAEGGAVINNSGATLTVNGGEFKNNHAFKYGGGIHQADGNVYLKGITSIQENQAIYGGVYVAKDAGHFYVQGSPDVVNNSGNVYLYENKITVNSQLWGGTNCFGAPTSMTVWSTVP